MIVICDKAQDIVIPAGLGDNAGVVYEKSGVESLNGQQGDLTLKTVNGNELLGEGDVAIDTGVESLNGQKGALNLKTVNGNELTGEGNIEIQAGVESVNGETGAVKIKSVNGQSLMGEGDVEIQAGLKYKQITNESRQEVYDDVKAHWDNASGYTGDYVYFYQNGVDQIIFDEVKFENNTAYFNSASVGYTSGQVHNPLVRLLCCIVPSEGDIQINENGRVLSDVNGMRYEAYDAIVDSNSITFQENGYGDGYDVYNTTDTGTKDGLFDVRFKNGLDGFKGNAPASIFTDGTDVFMAFDVVDNHYVYKRDGNAWAFVSKTKIGGESGGGGNQNVIVLDGLTQEERKAVYDKLDKSVPPKDIFKYNGAVSFYTYWEGNNYLKIFFLDTNGYGGGRVRQWSLDPEGWFREADIGMNYPNFLFLNVGDHAAEGADFECGYTGNYNEFMYRPYTEPNGYFLVLKKGIGDSTKKMVLPLTVLWDKEYDGSSDIPIRIQFTANEKLYTYLHGDANGKWLFESAKPITGGGGESSKTYYFFNDPTRDPNAPNAHNVEVFKAFDKAVQEGGAFNNFYIVSGNESSGQTPYNPILQVTKMEAADNGVWGGNKGYYVFAGQKNNENSDGFQVHKYCLTDIGGVVDFSVNAIDAGTWMSGVHSKIDDVLTAGGDIPFNFNYLETCDETFFWANSMGTKQGLYNISFNGGYDGFKGNVVADVYGNDSGVYMAFTVNNVRYTYKKNDTANKWELEKSVAIGGVQSSEVSKIKVLTQSEYDALEPKDPNTMYCIKGQ